MGDSAGEALKRLERLVARLRGPGGCPWDRRQTPRSMVPYLIEETYELADAILSGSARAVCEELGDVLFHLVFLAAMFQEQDEFDLARALEGIENKMVRRHPHVFGDSRVASTREIKRQWEEIKKEEHNHQGDDSILNSIPEGLPGLVKAYRVSARAARAGFDWNDLAGVMAKTMEEWGELKEVLDGRKDTVADDAPGDPGNAHNQAAALELGDLLFTLANVGRWARIHPETALRDATLKFERRFRHMEKKLAHAGHDLDGVSREELEQAWDEAKQELG